MKRLFLVPPFPLRFLRLTTRRGLLSGSLLALCLWLSAPVHASASSAADTTRAGTSVQVRTPPDEWIESYRSNPDYDYNRTTVTTGEPSLWDQFAEWLWAQLQPVVGTETGENLLEIGIYLIAILIVGFAIYLLLQMRTTAPFSSRRTFDTADSVVTRETMETVDFDAQADAALRDGRRRAAVRYRYLALLQALIRADRIDWAPNRTNLDYVDALRGKDGHDAFARATDGFEVVWYGDVTLSEAALDRLLETIRDARTRLTGAPDTDDVREDEGVPV